MTYKIGREYIIQTISDLVRINSVNPSLSPDGVGEAEIGSYVALEAFRAILESV